MLSCALIDANVTFGHAFRVAHFYAAQEGVDRKVGLP